MRTIALLCLINCLFLPGHAWAREEPETFTNLPAQQFATALDAPRRAGDCARFAPPSAVGFDGTTVLSAHILPDGRVSDSRIVTSSGRADLDRAATGCMSAMHLSPKTRDGIALAVDWQMEVIWPDGRARTARTGGEDYVCNSFYPSSAVHARREGDTLVSFVISQDGSVDNVSVIESSGNNDLDAATIECVSRFRYHPAMQDGKPVDIDGKFVAEWRLR